MWTVEEISGDVFLLKLSDDVGLDGTMGPAGNILRKPTRARVGDFDDVVVAAFG